MTQPFRDADALGAVEWPPERFFWAVLETTSIRKPCELPTTLLTELQEDLPCPVEETHAMCAPTKDGRIVVCAAKRVELDGMVEIASCLTPARLPAELSAFVSPTSLNLLVGDFEPSVTRHARVRQHVFAAALVFLAAVLGSVGLHRRAEHDRALAAKYDSQLRFIPESAVATPGQISVEDLRLLAEAASKSGIQAFDTPSDLADLLRAWPASVPSTPQSISLAADAVSVSVKIDGDPTPFLTAFHAPSSWKLEQPRVNTSGEVSRVNLELRRQNGGNP